MKHGKRLRVLFAFLPMLIAAAVGTLAASPAISAELLMFEAKGCPWCLRWKQEVGPAYPKTPEGQRAPVRSVELHGQRPHGVTLAMPVQFSPTFVLVDERGLEIGRIVGYPGADFFWGLLAEMVRKLPPKPAGS